ncbi:MAG: hypothetical protein U9N38_05730, partial [Thermodesulfobacteriota bacterium]|nr:hypothetical protein [Thermodesulfobacteriota bacterium]
EGIRIMTKKYRYYYLFLLFSLTLMLFSCAGLRYSQVNPNAKDFHPKTIGVLPVGVGAYSEAGGVVDQIFAGILVDKRWFSDVASPERIKSQMAYNSDLRKAVIDCLTKLKAVNFSDPELSRQIGEYYKIDAFLVINVDFWNYTTEGEDKVAKVGFSIKLVDAKTGKIMWEAGHHEVEDYWLIKPDLAGLADTVASKMIDSMPH